MTTKMTKAEEIEVMGCSPSREGYFTYLATVEQCSCVRCNDGDNKSMPMSVAYMPDDWKAELVDSEHNLFLIELPFDLEQWGVDMFEMFCSNDLRDLNVYIQMD